MYVLCLYCNGHVVIKWFIAMIMWLLNGLLNDHVVIKWLIGMIMWLLNAR